MDDSVRWLGISRAQVSAHMKVYDVYVSRHIVRKMLKKHGFVKRKLQRKRACGQHADRNQQFDIIAKKKFLFEENNDPIISIDTKKKESLGQLHRDGAVDCSAAVEVFDHDYQHLSVGKIIPHGIFDIANNKGYIHLGISSETADFICDSIGLWWNNYGKNNWPQATKILIFCDAGGANSYRHYLFKLALQELANHIGITLSIAHYPPYASKWNPIEHRLFPHVTRAMAGTPLLSRVDAKEKIEKTQTNKGLRVTCSLIEKAYEIGKRATKNMLEKINFKANKVLGKFNYEIGPQTI